MSYVRVSVFGSFSGGEQWSVNPVYDPTGEFPGGVDQTKLDAATLAIANRTIPADLLTLLTTSGARIGARVEVRDDATDALIGISIQGSTASLPGTGTLKLPFQAALVCSIRTNTPGASGRGRLYWPAMGATLGTTGRLSGPSPSATLTAFKTYLAGIQSDLGTSFTGIGFDLAVRSKTTHSTPHATRIQVGDLVDTQRRRRDNLPESYTSVAYP